MRIANEVEIDLLLLFYSVCFSAFTATLHGFCKELQVHVSQDQTTDSVYGEFIGGDVQPRSWHDIPTRLHLHKTVGHTS